jgi:type IV secretory pathway VirB10-like protein
VTARALFFLVPLLLALCAGQANAQTIYKCTVDGKTSYGEARCAAGNSVVLPTPAAPERSDFDQPARRQQQAEQLTTQRHRREAREEQAQQRADKQAAKKRDRCASLKLQRQWADEDAAHAMRGRNAGQAALKARRAGEKFAMACPD